MNKNILILFSLITLSLISCNNKSKNDDPVILVTENDNEINTAINKARFAFGQFEKAFIENQETNAYSYFSIKEGFPTKDDTASVLGNTQDSGCCGTKDSPAAQSCCDSSPKSDGSKCC